MGQLPLRLHRGPNADGDGRQRDRQPQRRSAQLNPREQDRPDAGEVAGRVVRKDNKRNRRVHRSPPQSRRKDHRVTNRLMLGVNARHVTMNDPGYIPEFFKIFIALSRSLSLSPRRPMSGFDCGVIRG